MLVILKFAQERKNMLCHIFSSRAKRQQSGRGKRPQAQERKAVEDLNGGDPREAWGVDRLSRKRHS